MIQALKIIGVGVGLGVLFTYDGLLTSICSLILSLDSEQVISFLILPTVIKNEKGTNPIVSKLSSWWTTGFSDAESSFQINIRKNDVLRVGWQVQLVFAIKLHIKDLPLLENIKQFFGVGEIRLGENFAVFYVTALNDLIEVIIPHFNKYPLLTQKQADF